VGHNFLYSKIDKIEQRFDKAEMIGIACGLVSDGFYCIDFDRHQGQELEPIFNEFFQFAAIKDFINRGLITCAKTPSGGFHAYLKTPHDIKGTVISKYTDGNTMIEMRGKGQYCASPPSYGYAMLTNLELSEIGTMEKHEFDWVISYCSTFNKHGEFQLLDEKKSERKWPDKWDDSKPEGNFNNTQADYAKQLLHSIGWKKLFTRYDGVEMWQRPGKTPDQGASATFGAKFNMFYVFTKKAEPFEEQRAYSPFQIFTIIEHNGDWKKAKDAISPKIVIRDEPEAVKTKNPFPIDAFPQFLQDYIIELKQVFNFHHDFSAAAAMFSLATINGNFYKLKVKNGWNAPTIFWFACVGHPGAIKTHPVKNMIDPIYDIDDLSKRFYDNEMMAYDPDAKPKKPKPKFRQILISDYTIEALHSIHDINKRGIGLYKDELVGFLNDMNKYRKGSDEQFWLESINNGSYTVNRVSKEPIMIRNICINIVGTIQHDVLDRVISEYSGNGLVDRFLFTESEAQVYPISTFEIDEYFYQHYSEIVKLANRRLNYMEPKDTILLNMDSETFDVYRQIDLQYVNKQLDSDLNISIKNYLSKMKTYVPRFALLLAIMDGLFNDMHIEVTPDHMANAGRIADYFINSAQNIFVQTDRTQQIKERVNSMRNKTRKEQIVSLYSEDFTQAEIAKLFKISRQAVSKCLTKS
jgi:hypothetical protein